MDIPENITAKQMYDELVEAVAGKGHCYLLLDEIQEIIGWERAVNSLLEGADADIYVTGSANSISTFLKSEHCKVSVESIYNYLRWLEQAFIIYPCERYDLQGKSILKTQEKYYLADVTLNDMDAGIENGIKIVHLQDFLLAEMW